jgi:hypothetical protein
MSEVIQGLLDNGRVHVTRNILNYSHRVIKVARQQLYGIGVSMDQLSSLHAVKGAEDLPAGNLPEMNSIE